MDIFYLSKVVRCGCFIFFVDVGVSRPRRRSVREGAREDVCVRTFRWFRHRRTAWGAVRGERGRWTMTRM